MSADQIQRLPVNPSRSISPQEEKIMNTMFGTAASAASCNSPLKLIVSGLVFFILSLPFVETFLKGKISASDMVILAIKTGLFLLALIVVQLFV